MSVGRERNHKTQAPVVLIPAGDYPYDLLGRSHTIERDLWVDVFPVRLRDFGRFVADGGYFNTEFLWEQHRRKLKPAEDSEDAQPPFLWEEHRRKLKPAEDSEDAQPLSGADGLLDSLEYDEKTCLQAMIGASWFEAYAYARWAGGRLPYEREWGVAACEPAQVTEEALASLGISTTWLTVSGAKRFKPRHFLSRQGCYGMGILVREWCMFESSSGPRGQQRDVHVCIARGNPVIAPGSREAVLEDRWQYSPKTLDPQQQIGFRCVYESVKEEQ